MRIVNLSVKNFRGVEEAEVKFPLDTRITCIIGPGDSTKTTLLNAISWVLWPTWNLTVADTDFFNCDVTKSIEIEITLTELPIQLISEDRFGFLLRRLNITAGELDEPVDEEPVCLTIHLTINNDLEPDWKVVCNHHEPKQISYKERQILALGFIGDQYTKDLTWSKSSVLQKYADSKGIIREVYISVLREAAKTADLCRLDDISETIKEVGKEFGVTLNDIHNELFSSGLSYAAQTILVEGKSPLNQRGLGSQRLLSMGLNIKAFSDGAILLVDEVETGLEPYRIINLICSFRRLAAEKGQIIMTTHSQEVICECMVSEIMVIHSSAGKTKAEMISTSEPANRSLQQLIRRNPVALLCPRILVCEGKTEIGFCRALDNYLFVKEKSCLASNGVSVTLGEGDSLAAMVEHLILCGYEVSVFMDSDKEKTKKDVENLAQKYGIKIFSWASGNAIEEQVFFDVPDRVAEQLLSIALNEIGEEEMIKKLFGLSAVVKDEKVTLSCKDADERKLIGSLAKEKKQSWYKRIDLGERFGDCIFENWDIIDDNSGLKRTVNEIITWVTKND